MESNYITVTELKQILEIIEALNGIQSKGVELSTRYYDSNGDSLGRIERANGDGDYVFIPGA